MGDQRATAMSGRDDVTPFKIILVSIYLLEIGIKRGGVHRERTIQRKTYRPASILIKLSQKVEVKVLNPGF